MASLYQQPKSSFWWIKFRDPATNKICRASTGFHHGVGSETRRARELEAQKTLQERQSPSLKTGAWDSWVTDFIREQHSDRSLERYLTAWRTIRMFLVEHKIAFPAQVNYENAAAYVPWRLVPDVRNGKYRCRRNTANYEFKIFRWLMRQAVRKNFCPTNPAREIVLNDDATRQFPDFSDDQLQEIHQSILREPEPDRTRLLHSFAIAILHGVRSAETNPNPCADLIFEKDFVVVRFVQKGARVRFKPLHPQLVPLFQRLRADGATTFYPVESGDGYAPGYWRNAFSKRWMRFLRQNGFASKEFFTRHGLNFTEPNSCFHSFRVTVENVLREAGVEQRVRELYLTHEHGSDDINAKYDRVKLREMVTCHQPLERKWLKLE